MNTIFIIVVVLVVVSVVLVFNSIFTTKYAAFIFLQNFSIQFIVSIHLRFYLIIGAILVLAYNILEQSGSKIIIDTFIHCLLLYF